MKLRAANKAFTTIAANISAVATEIEYIDATGFPSDGPFVATIGDEIILFESRAGNICTVATTAGTLGVNGRGYDGTSATPHTEGDTVANKITAAYVNNLWDELSLNSTGGEVNGDLIVNGTITVNSSGSTEGNAITGDLSVDGNLDITGNLTVTVSSGSTATMDFGGATLKDATMQGYAEKHLSVIPTTANVLTLDAAESNVFYVTLTGKVENLIITNASTEHTTPLTMELLLTADYSTDHFFAWQTPVTIANASTILSASTEDSSFNATSGFSTNLQPGDIITITGFSTDAEANNDSWRVKSATASKIVVLNDDDTIVTKAAGDAVTVTRRKEMFTDTTVPDFPEPYIPKTFTMYSKDGDRWKVVEVGEF